MKVLYGVLMLSSLLLTGDLYAQESGGEDDSLQPIRPWCKITSSVIDVRSKSAWTRSVVNYEWSGLTATLSGNTIGVMEYNRWGYLVYKRWRSHDRPEGSEFERRYEWNCERGWCYPLSYGELIMDERRRLNGELSEDHISYNEFGYQTHFRSDQGPDFHRTSTLYECEGIWCAPLEEVEVNSCNLCNGWSEIKSTQYRWSGHEAQISGTIRSGSNLKTTRLSKGVIKVSATRQTLYKQLSHSDGSSIEERHTYRCDH